MSAESFEAHLRDRPDDLAGWSAYADWLAEHSDPRGELMRVQLALENESLTKSEREALKAAESEWLARNHPLGMLDGLLPLDQVRFARGFPVALVNLDVSEEHPEVFLSQLATSDELRWVRSVRIDYLFEDTPLTPLAGATFAPHLQTLWIGEGERYTHTEANGLPLVVAGCPRLESLTVCADRLDTDALFAAPMPAMLELGVHCCTNFPCDRLADNPTLGNLTRLAFTPHALEPDDDGAYLDGEDLRAIARSPHLNGLRHLAFRVSDAGDDGVLILAASGMLHRLETLDLSYGRVTDAGARELVRALRARPSRLTAIDLTANALTPTGVAALQAAGLSVTAADQHSPDSDDFLVHGDWE